jgi:hypothetical protein
MLRRFWSEVSLRIRRYAGLLLLLLLLLLSLLSDWCL